MKIPISKEMLGELPAPDSGGLVRVKVALKVNADSGEAEIVEVNGSPVSSGTDEDGMTQDDRNPMPSSSIPDLDAAEADIYKQ